jgi:hypothetical protein
MNGMKMFSTAFSVILFILTLCLAGVGLGAESVEETPLSVPAAAAVEAPTALPPAAAPTAPFMAAPGEVGGEEPAGAAPDTLRTRTVDITGTYHPEQGLFEQNFSNKFFYTDIENGGMTSSSVYIELPAGISVRMERDGTAAAFVNRMNVTEPGAYVLNLSFMDDQGVNINGVFRFRIAGRDELGTGDDVTDSGTPDDGMMTEEEINALIDSYLYDDIGAAAGGGARVLTGNGIYTGLDELYDTRAGMFLETTVTERGFFSNIPNGAVVNFPAAFTFPAQFGEISVTRNDEAYPYIPGGTIAEDGAYCMTFGAGDLIVGMAAATPPPSFNFRIITRPAADLDIYNAPWGYKIVEAARDGAPLNYRGDVVMLEEDGLYTFELTAEYAEVSGLMVEFRRDTTAPEFRLNGVSGGVSTGLAVTVEYLSEDASAVQLFKDGEEIRYYMDDVISEPGQYYLVVYDEAGNFTTAGFEMRYRLDPASISLIFGLIGLLILLAVLVLIRGRRDLRVR